jgi:hypothetical protein
MVSCAWSEFRAQTYLSHHSEAAYRAGIPAFIVSNFTFDTIYAHISFTAKAYDLDGHSPVDRLSGLMSRMTAAYAKAQCVFQLPGSLPITAFANTASDTAKHVISVPCSPRPIWHTPEETRTELDLPLTVPILLIAFGGHHQALDA